MNFYRKFYPKAIFSSILDITPEFLRKNNIKAILLDVDNTLANALEYDPLDFTAPLDSKKLNVRPVAYAEINPFKNLYGRTGVFSVDTSDLSFKELAQQGKVFDYDKKEWTNKTANDLGLFGTLFNETLVYATWDEDGYSIDPITNRQVAHKKGE